MQRKREAARVAIERPDMSLWENIRTKEASEGWRVASQAPKPPQSSSEDRPQAARAMGEDTGMANIGKSISIKGDVVGNEDTVIEGRIEGRVELKNHHLTIGANGYVQGEVAAKQVTILGRVAGNVVATERAELQETGRLEGDLSSPRLQVQAGARVNGKISMAPASGAAGPESDPESAPDVEVHAS